MSSVETVQGGPSLAQERKLVTSIPGPKSQALLERKNGAVATGVGLAYPTFIVAAGGGVMVDADGNSLIDLGSGIAVTGVGNAAPAVVEAVQDQVARFTHTCFTVTPYEAYVDVAEKLNELTPGSHDKRSALFNSGAEAIENAIKIARHFTKKQAIVVFDHGYHGRTNLTMGMTAKNMPYKDGFGPFAPEIYRLPASYPYRDQLSGPEAAKRAILAIEKQIGANNLAAIIIEPIQGEGGFIVPAAGFLPAIAEWSRANNVVFILDEVQTGFARTGQMFAADYEGVVADVVTTAKGIAGGLPLSAVTGRADIMNSAHAGGLGGTYAGSPVAARAALATIDTYARENLLARANEIGAVITKTFTDLQKSDSRIGDVRGRGAMMAIEIVKAGTNEPDAELTGKIAAEAFKQGVILLTCGTYGNVIRFLPPLSISDELLAEGLGVVVDLFAANA
jgi:4-aminobutyrate aminotransferase/(S)-3-amino-2-methylpropionate transaminase